MLLAPLFHSSSPSSDIIHTRLLLYAVAFAETLHCASVYELMTSPGSPPLRAGPSVLENSTAKKKKRQTPPPVMIGSSIHDDQYP